MGEVWELPALEDIVYMGPEWLFDLLRTAACETRNRLIMLIWRLWQLHNDATHGKLLAPVEASRKFLRSYASSLFAIDHSQGKDILKGKQVVAEEVSVDGSFKDGMAGLGAIIRDPDGHVLLSAREFVAHCSEALVVEAMSFLFGVSLALQHTTLLLIVHSDCDVLVQAVHSNKMERSSIGFLLREIVQLIRGDRELILKKIDRHHNKAADLLAISYTVRLDVGIGGQNSELELGFPNSAVRMFRELGDGIEGQYHGIEPRLKDPVLNTEPRPSELS
ncbi:hypothetical protein BRADI_2g52220v3 [Brachypodium distachyon]|uniref:RNase H type-1 domain-containing protein n=1 Tax=Brachypodium distachyon TaxID=15368 RepID=I1HSE8_BRADI|nr:hypothetical protein BRADI_2g52220v3 [Brachypodium distachyon]